MGFQAPFSMELSQVSVPSLCYEGFFVFVKLYKSEEHLFKKSALPTPDISQKLYPCSIKQHEGAVIFNLRAFLANSLPTANTMAPFWDLCEPNPFLHFLLYFDGFFLAVLLHGKSPSPLSQKSSINHRHLTKGICGPSLLLQKQSPF